MTFKTRGSLSSSPFPSRTAKLETKRRASKIRWTVGPFLIMTLRKVHFEEEEDDGRMKAAAEAEAAVVMCRFSGLQFPRGRKSALQSARPAEFN